MKQERNRQDNMEDMFILGLGLTFTSAKSQKLHDNIKKTNLPLVMKTNVGERKLKEYRTLPGFKQKCGWTKNRSQIYSA